MKTIFGENGLSFYVVYVAHPYNVNLFEVKVEKIGK